MDWDTVFPADMAPTRRLDVAKTLCEADSKNVVQVIVKAMQAVYLKVSKERCSIDNRHKTARGIGG